MSFLTKIFGEPNEKYLRGLTATLLKINNLEKRLKSFSDSQLREKTFEFRKLLGEGESLDEILAEAFALVREASKRTLGQRHFDCQMIGGIVLHQAKIAEMKTGEGKTLAATLPLYLNALSGKGCHLVTVNDYLAKRDSVWMGQIYDLLGLSVSCIVHDAAYLYDAKYMGESPKSEIRNKLQIPNGERDEERDLKGGFKVVESYLRPCSRKEAYLADITYGTNNEFGFDYLRDNMVYDLENRAQRDFHYAIIDEVDSILIDEARTPLIISAPDIEAPHWYREFAKIVPKLNKEADYEIDEKMRTVSLTEKGIQEVEKILGSSNIYEEKGIKYLHHLEQALRAQALNPKTGQPLFARERDYVVKRGEVIIVDEFTGRLMPGRRWSGGLHQAIEAKEGVEIRPESITLATITFQNYFRLYKKLAGMTGTALTSAEEFDKVYGLDAVAVPTNKSMIRRDLPDRIYKTEDVKFKELVEEIKERHKRSQPLLVGTRSIEKNEYLGKMLETEGITHQILNAKNHEREGEIIAQAGKLGAVTIATNMAGRGVDIMLGGVPSSKLKVKSEKLKVEKEEDIEFKKWQEEHNKVIALGGLHVIGTERHEARRIDNQLRGRAGRQGDPGSSQFFISLEDDLMRIFGGEKISSLMERLKMPEDQPIEAKIISRLVEASQAKIEGMNFDLRKHVLEYDDVMNKHREVIYRKRREILGKCQMSNVKCQNLKDYILQIIKKQGFSEDDYLKKEREIGEENMRQLEKLICLRVIDSFWIDHLYAMEHLRDSVRLRGYGQQDPLIEYKREGQGLFVQLLAAVESNIAKTLMAMTVNAPKDPPPNFGGGLTGQARPVGDASDLVPGQKIQQPVQPHYGQRKQKIGRNEPCPCGSGKKYKRCHGGSV